MPFSALHSKMRVGAESRQCCVSRVGKVHPAQVFFSKNSDIENLWLCALVSSAG